MKERKKEKKERKKKKGKRKKDSKKECLHAQNLDFNLFAPSHYKK